MSDTLTPEETERYIASLERDSGMTREQFLALCASGKRPQGSFYVTWLLLLGRGDLLTPAEAGRVLASTGEVVHWVSPEKIVCGAVITGVNDSGSTSLTVFERGSIRYLDGVLYSEGYKPDHWTYPRRDISHAKSTITQYLDSRGSLTGTDRKRIYEALDSIAGARSPCRSEIAGAAPTPPADAGFAQVVGEVCGSEIRALRAAVRAQGWVWQQETNDGGAVRLTIRRR